MPGVRVRPDLPPANRTLGWAVLEWMVDNLVHAVTNDPLELIPELEHFVLTYYAIDENGRWLYDRAALRRARGTGKSPVGAALACAELACEHVRFSHFHPVTGLPVGRPADAPWVQITATSLEQTRPIMAIVVASWSEDSIDKYQLEIGKEAITKGTFPRGRLAAVANNPRGLRGPRPSAVFADEVSEWVSSNGGHEAMVRINSNLAKSPNGEARLVEFCNAYNPGEDSHAERTNHAHAKQMEQHGVSRILLDTLEADPALRLNVDSELREAIKQAAGDAFWLDVDRLVATALDPGTTVTVFRREHLNQILSSDDSLISSQLYDELAADVNPITVTDAITLGFDGSLSGDGTAIVAFRLSDRSFHVLKYWEPDPLEPGWRIDEGEVDETMRAYIEGFNVVATACDVHPFESWVYAWERDYGQQMQAKVSPAGNLIRDNRSDLRNLTFLTEALVNEIESRKIRFRPSMMARLHWANAKRRLNRHGYSYGKVTKSSTKRVDIVAASLMAYAAATALAKDFNPKVIRPARVVQLKD